MESKNIFKTLAILVVLAIALVLIFKIGVPRTEHVDTPTDSPTSTRATLSGEYLCIHKITDSQKAEEKTEDCVPGLKTDDSKYYALDYNLMSQTRPEIALGDRIEASGLVTPIEALSSDQWQVYKLTGIFSVTDSFRKLNTAPIPYECNGDAKICADGSSVGRTGSECQFAACPAPDATSGKVITSIGQESTVMNVTIKPTKII
ncbi:MAG: hypothetical protein RL641_833, partial [Candidatus Parcubacteria bacterium]